MFSELPKLFDRNFAMAFFMPVAIFIALSIAMLNNNQLTQNILPDLEVDLLIGATFLGLVSWLGGIFLLVTNRDIYRLVEGYGKFNPALLVGWLQKRKYEKLIETLDELDNEFIELGEEFPSESRMKRDAIMKELSDQFPDQKKWLLPTAFGNTLRAFEVYPRVMYGIESIDGWSRLIAVIPEDFRILIDNAKAQVDFWVNIGVVGLLLFVEYLSIAYYVKSVNSLWILIIILLMILIAPWRARRVAVEWGDMVKAAFDIYRFKLIAALGIDEPRNRDEEREIWTKYSQAVIYRLPDELPDLKKAESKPERKISN
jgi:hypothetical protein